MGVQTTITCCWCGGRKLGSTYTYTQPKTGQSVERDVCNHCWDAFLHGTAHKRCACRTCKALKVRHPNAH